MPNRRQHRAILAALFVTLLAQAQPPAVSKSIAPILTSRKLALVIGNANYQYQPPIPQALNDAADISATLKSLDFTVTTLTNAHVGDLDRALETFYRSITPGSLALFYYSGHGGSLGEDNYLLPIEFQQQDTESGVERVALAMSKIRNRLEAQGARVRLLIFDACRNAALVASKDAASGLVELKGKPEGTLIAYASAHGQVSRFSTSGAQQLLHRRADQPPQGFPPRHGSQVAARRHCRRRVSGNGSHANAYLYGRLFGKLYLRGEGTGTVVVSKPPAPASICGDAWAMVKDATDVASLKTFTQDFAECMSEVRLANLRLKTLDRRVDPPPSLPVTQENNSPRVNPKDGLTYVWIPPGRFRMGCSTGDTECDASGEKPAHDVQITKGFWLSRTETTQAAYQGVTGTNPSNFKGANLPVEQVTWNESASYCRAIGGRLPTEAEWEYAARGGKASARYGDVDAVAWYLKNSGGTTHDVAQKTPNEFGLYDMLGNVYEWTADWYSKEYHATSPSPDPAGPSSGILKALRGGGWDFNPILVRASNRISNVPGDRGFAFGFRCLWEQRFH